MSELSPNEQYKLLLKQTSKRSKYGNTRIEREGIWYDSIAEYRYKGVLDLEVIAGLIKGYDFHVNLPLNAEGGNLVGYYEIDYLVYMPDGSQQIRDVKGKADRKFLWKKKHVKAQYGMDIILIDAQTLKPIKTK